MSASEYIKELRASIGDSLLLLPGVAAVVSDHNNRILLQEKNGEAWSLPAGMIEPGESPKTAVIREVREETGLIVAPQKVPGVFGGDQFRYVCPNADSVEYTIILFRCTVEIDIGSNADSETRSLRYFEKQEMPDLALPYPIELLFDELASPIIN